MRCVCSATKKCRGNLSILEVWGETNKTRKKDKAGAEDAAPSHSHSHSMPSALFSLSGLRRTRQREGSTYGNRRSSTGGTQPVRQDTRLVSFSFSLSGVFLLSSVVYMEQTGTDNVRGLNSGVMSWHDDSVQQVRTEDMGIQRERGKEKKEKGKNKRIR